MATPLITWQLRYTLTPTVARCLMEIEAAKAVVEHTQLTLAGWW